MDQQATSDSRPTRRKFCVCALGVTALAPLVEGCGGAGNPAAPTDSVPQLPVVNATRTNSVVSITIDASSPLASVGSAALVNYGAGGFLVAHTSQESFSALTPICTHQGCTISGYSGGHYVCPCHGSTFDTSGRVLSGPASRPLTTFPTQFSNNVLTISG